MNDKLSLSDVLFIIYALYFIKFEDLQKECERYKKFKIDKGVKNYGYKG